MGLFDRYQMTLKGADNEAMSSNPVTVTIWFEAAPDTEEFLGEVTDYHGGYALDAPLFRTSWPVRTIPFGYVDESWEGHDRARLASLRSVVRKPYRQITAVSGPDVVGDDGVADYWTEALSGGPIDVYLSDYTEANPDDNTTRVTFTLKRRELS